MEYSVGKWDRSEEPDRRAGRRRRRRWWTGELVVDWWTGVGGEQVGAVANWSPYEKREEDDRRELKEEEEPNRSGRQI